MSMNPRERAARLIALRVIADWIRAEDRRLRDEATHDMLTGDRVAGVLADEPIGFVQKVHGRETPTVTDPAELLGWVKDMAPGEVVTTEAVRPAFLQKLLADTKTHGGWVTPDGEIEPAPGIEVRAGEPTLTVKAAAEADGVVRDALITRRLAIEPGGAL